MRRISALAADAPSFAVTYAKNGCTMAKTEVHTEHRLEREQATKTAVLRVVRLDQRAQPRPWNDGVHFAQEALTAGHFPCVSFANVHYSLMHSPALRRSGLARLRHYYVTQVKTHERRKVSLRQFCAGERAA